MPQMSEIGPALWVLTLLFKPLFLSWSFYPGFNCTFITSGKGRKITDKKVRLYKIEYMKIDETNEIINKKSTWKLKKPWGTC